MVKEDVLVNTWKTDVTDGLIDDIIEEVKARMDNIQGQSCGCRRKPKVPVSYTHLTLPTTERV